MGFDLNATASYDASAADGIRFWAKSSVPFNFSVPTPETVPRANGGACDTNCDSHPWFWVEGSVADWTEVRVPFTALRQPNGYDDDFNLLVPDLNWSPAAISRLEFSVSGLDGRDPFELWIDDVSFYSCTGDGCLPTCLSSLAVACPPAGSLPAACWPAGTDCARASDQVTYNAVWGSGPADVWAVGYSLFTHKGVIDHYDGTSWTAVGGVTSAVWDVRGTGADAAWVVADNGVVGRWDGQAWTSTDSGIKGSYNSVWAGAADDIWAIVYPGTLRHWNGSAWSTSRSGATLLGTVWGSGPGDVWAVGEAGTILHWDGAAWKMSTEGAHHLSGVWGSRADDVWAVGAMGTILHWNGVAWSSSAPVTSHDLFDVWGSGANDVWAVGNAGTALHFDGSRWQPVDVPTERYLSGVWGSGPADVWAVGDLGTILHWDGTAWSTVTVGR